MYRMNMHRRLATLVSAATITALAATSVSAQSAGVTTASSHSFAETVSGLKGAVAQGGMMVMADVDQGNMLKMVGLNLKATLFLVGNPTVGKQVLEKDPAAGLYMPLRVYVYEDAKGKTFVSYDRPSMLLAQFKNGDVDKVAAMLDQKLGSLVQMVTK